MQSSHRCWAEINLRYLSENINLLNNHVGGSNQILAVVKANAYGHGLEGVTSALLKCPIRGFGVANVAEAKRVYEVAKNEQIAAPFIVVLSPVLPTEIETAIEHGFVCSVSDVEEVKAFETKAASKGQGIYLHAVIDTGMGRMGARLDVADELVTCIAKSKHCTLTGIATHFPSADEDSQFTKGQIERFRNLIQQNSKLQGSEVEIHLANSAGILDFSDQIDYANFSRVGLALYGVSPDCKTVLPIKPVLSLKSRIILVREIAPGTTISYGGTFVAEQPMRVATISSGYGDGYPRHVSGQGADVLIAGQRCPVLGRVTMDQTVVDISSIPGPVAIGDEVVLFGGQGDEMITVGEIAAKAGTIPWEVLTGITPRVQRVYIDS